jgi:putative ATPase
MKNIGYGKEYEYSHAYKDNFTAQEYLPDNLSGTLLYNPGNNAAEEKLRERLKTLWKGKYKY